MPEQFLAADDLKKHGKAACTHTCASYCWKWDITKSSSYLQLTFSCTNYTITVKEFHINIKKTGGMHQFAAENIYLW